MKKSMKIYIDEAWRWPLAWPVFVWLTIVFSDVQSDLFQDSKKLSVKKRELAYKLIKDFIFEKKILTISTYSSSYFINKYWIVSAISNAILKWIKKIWLNKKNIELIIDWNTDFGLRKKWYNVKTIIKWDEKIPYISISSIVAKVDRDCYMKKLSKKYPLYWFDKHKWYWTKFHIFQIKKYWKCSEHRDLYIRNFL